MMEGPCLTEEEMTEIKKDVLIRMWHYLCETIRAERHLDFLRSRRILSRDDAEEISCRTTQRKRTALLLDFLMDNPHGLDSLLDSIREMRSQNFIITKVTDELQKAKNEKIESLRALASSSSDVTSPATTSTSDLSFSNTSTMLFHPDGEKSPSTSDLGASLDLMHVQKGAELSSVACANLPSTSSSLPKPGDPGAPPLPEEMLVVSPSNVDAASPGCSSTGGDPNFHPLRSRSITPNANRSLF
ncbi:B-cell lymphoma/leukemia 10 [Eucyclogobius newberryi]|uniref:B-cell lymphoma/leukemia 10 n=1 Tax=Eucyclogobius newberryi TaxID=166745 RepID=UPI003B5CECA4